MINYDNVTKINKYNWNWPHIPDHPYRKLITGGTEFRKANPLLKPYVHYFSLSLKEKCISSLLWTKYIKKKFNLPLFFFPSFHEHLLSLELPPFCEHSLSLELIHAARLLKFSCFEKGTACVTKTMLMT